METNFELSVKQLTFFCQMSVNCEGEKLTVSRRKAKILVVNCKCLHPTESPIVAKLEF